MSILVKRRDSSCRRTLILPLPGSEIMVMVRIRAKQNINYVSGNNLMMRFVYMAGYIGSRGRVEVVQNSLLCSTNSRPKHSQHNRKLANRYSHPIIVLQGFTLSKKWNASQFSALYVVYTPTFSKITLKILVGLYMKNRKEKGSR